MAIRKTVLNDLERIIDLETKFLGETIGHEMLEQELNNPVACFFTAEIDEKVVGYIGAWIIEDTIEVINLVVDENYQRQGLGSALIKALIAEAINPHKMILDVRTTNHKALNFYHKLGFIEVGKRKSYYKNGDDALTMVLEIMKGDNNEDFSN